MTDTNLDESGKGGKDMLKSKDNVAPQELLVVGAALKAGIFDILRERPTTLNDLVNDFSMDRRAIWTVMEALISLGYISKDKDILQVTSDAIELFFNENSENYIGYSLIHTFNVIKAWTNLPEILKTGQPGQCVRGRQDRAGFMAAMKKSAQGVAEQITKICLDNLPSGSSVLDLGGGPLNYARFFAMAGANVTVQDIPEICALMETNILPEEKIKFVSGDFTEAISPGQFDLAFLGNICHIYGEEENLLLFRRVHDSLGPSGRIGILDFVRGTSPRADLFAVNMLANTKTGGTWTLKQYTEWLKIAGFHQIELHNIADKQIITAFKAPNV